MPCSQLSQRYKSVSTSTLLCIKLSNTVDTTLCSDHPTPQRRRNHCPHSKSRIHQYCQKINTRQTTTSDALSQEPQIPTITIRVTVLNGWGYPERNLQVKMRYNMPFGELVALFQTKFGMPEYFGLEMKARKGYGDGLVIHPF